MSEVNILSPHYDDAVLGAWQQVEQNDSQVTTIFGGSPSEITPSGWDRLTGFRSAIDAMRTRRHENKEALSHTGTTIVDLNFPEYLYRKEPLEVADITQAVTAQSQTNALYLAPAGVAAKGPAHVDHVLTRSVGKELLAQGSQVAFYLDIPYMLPVFRLHQWVSRLSKEQLKQSLEIDFDIDVRELSEEEQHRKHTAYKTYKSQVMMMGLVSFGALQRAAAFTQEVILWPK